ncbi:hypothetical protein EDC96DRAFT_505278 [Choanephora cucurbitarum]|nr:hypothetical protein EDC96DRAFT_505278 [Choanephora cucurbitarum]
MSPTNHFGNTVYYNQQYYPNNYTYQPQNTSPTLSASSINSQSSRLGQIEAQHELARNFYDDFEFCPVQCSYEVLEHRDRIHQRLSPQSSPVTSPSMSSISSLGSTTPPPKRNTRKAIPIINPSNMAPVSVPQHKSVNYRQPRPYQYHSYDVLVQ